MVGSRVRRRSAAAGLGAGLAALVLFLAPAGAAQCDPDTLRDLSPDGATIQPGTLDLLSRGQRYPAALKAPRGAAAPSAHHQAEIVRVAPGDRGAFRFGAVSCATDDTCTRTDTQKVNIHTLYGDPRTRRLLSDGARAFFGFSFSIETARPEKPTILVQIWQGAPHAPPFAAILDPVENGRLDMSFSILNAETGSNPSAKRLRIGEVRDLKPGVWYAAIIEAAPTFGRANSRPELPSLRVWWKERDAETGFRTVANHTGSWGFPTGPDGGCVYARRCETRSPNQALDFTFGVYRAMDRTPISILFGPVRVGRTMKGADPEASCG